MALNVCFVPHCLLQVLQKQIDKWDREKQARRRLMAEVIAVRHEQVAAKRLTHCVMSVG